MISPEVLAVATKLIFNKQDQTIIIAIDGLGGAGKTSFAKQLFYYFRREKIRLVHIDEYITGDSIKGFFDYLNWELLEKDFDQIRRRYRLILVEGIIILKVLAKLQFMQKELIYVEPQDDNPISKTFQKIKAGKDYTADNDLDNEIIDYHLKFKPQETANHKFKFAGSWCN